MRCFDASISLKRGFEPSECIDLSAWKGRHIWRVVEDVAAGGWGSLPARWRSAAR